MHHIILILYFRLLCFHISNKKLEILFCFYFIFFRRQHFENGLVDAMYHQFDTFNIIICDRIIYWSQDVHDYRHLYDNPIGFKSAKCVKCVI